ncbi:unnamed protein product [Bursaphelenchus xylophilus]|uniref:(pine wood nematode) hypothetical protein n=1 Tax=Bursaphelenchus xylophilus TaxID=6326 RepID=A0A1I7S4B0_BURXY|nr:unnamed protein product [Bursaphelenchus xylophilus]CAG9116905.1 unnamed protein product [Bursaphelenchus xylophilus]
MAESNYGTPGADAAVKAAEDEAKSQIAKDKNKGKDKDKIKDEEKLSKLNETMRDPNPPKRSIDASTFDEPTRLIQFDPEKNLTMIPGETRIIFGTNLNDFDVMVKVEATGCKATVTRNSTVPPQDTCNIEVYYEKKTDPLSTEKASVTIRMCKANGTDKCTQVITILGKHGSGQLRKKPMKTTIVRKAKLKSDLNAREKSGVFLMAKKGVDYLEFRAFEVFHEDEKLYDDL